MGISRKPCHWAIEGRGDGGGEVGGGGWVKGEGAVERGGRGVIVQIRVILSVSPPNFLQAATALF